MCSDAVRRTIEHRIENPLSLRILEGDFAEGQTVTVDADGEGFSFE